jgi:uncharacterized protein
MSTRAVFDCNVFLQSAASEAGPAAACFRLVRTGLLELHISDPIILELVDVLARPKLRAKFPALTRERVHQFIADVQALAVRTASVPQTYAYPRDPDDEHYINLALAVDADYLVSRDHDLLDLSNRSIAAGREFNARFPTLHIVDPVELLRILHP